MKATTLRQRADLTHKHNRSKGRHGWLRLTPAYSLKLVDEILDDHADCRRVFDPFSGTGTTPLAAVNRGHDAVACDINPFLIWLGNTKLANYQSHTVNSLRCFSQNLDLADCEPSDPPPLANIERWWDEDALTFLKLLRSKINAEAKTSSPVRSLLDVAFCRTLIDVSNAAFNHQSMSFRDKAKTSNQMLMFPERDSFPLVFEKDVELVASGAEHKPRGRATILHADSRDLSELQFERCDLLITSPPYPNRMSYIRELRPYMYWLGFLKEAREAGELDWETIGGTWGIATSLLKNWTAPKGAYVPAYLRSAIREVAGSDSKHAITLSQYIAKYFVDIWQHLGCVSNAMDSRSRVYYIVGNSTFYGTLIPVERVYADMLKKLGFRNVSYKAIRKRNSKKELYEYVVTAEVP